MTLDKHRMDGLPKILDRTMVSSRFEQLLIDAGYSKVGTAKSARAIALKLGGYTHIIDESRLSTQPTNH